MTFHINYDTYTTFKLIVTKPDPIEGNFETVVGEWYDISLKEVNHIILNIEKILG